MKSGILFLPEVCKITDVKKLKRIIAYLLRIDIFNRIIVFISMCLFLVVPSIVLYNIGEISTNYSTILPCLILLSVLLGTGAFALYKPTRVTIFYFAELIFIYVFFSGTFLNLPTVGMEGFNQSAVFWCEFAYCVMGAVINLVYYLRVVLKRVNYKTAMDEDTNNDNPEDFISASSQNEDVEKNLKEIARIGGNNAVAFVRNIKLSRFLRAVSYVISLISYIYYISVTNGTGYVITQAAIAGLVISTVLIMSSFAQPKDFKYVYYYNQFILEIAVLLVCPQSQSSPVLVILSLVALFLSFLLTMIVEGRRWMGATKDQDK